MERIQTLYSEEFLTDYRTVDCENPDRVTEIYFRIKDIADFIDPEPCTISDLRLCHSESLIKSVERGGEVFEVAKKAAGGAIKAAEISLQNPALRSSGHPVIMQDTTLMGVSAFSTIWL